MDNKEIESLDFDSDDLIVEPASVVEAPTMVNMASESTQTVDTSTIASEIVRQTEQFSDKKNIDVEKKNNKFIIWFLFIAMAAMIILLPFLLQL